MPVMNLIPAVLAAYGTFQRVFSNPGEKVEVPAYINFQDRYALLWHYYGNTIFDTLADWAVYKRDNRLYKFTTSIYNPTRRLVDFYAANVYPGTLTADANRYGDGTVIAIPFSDDTPQALRAAVGQLWRWSNWQEGKALMARYTAALGDCLIEIVDDVERRKVYFEIVWPGKVKKLELDVLGNVKAYTIEYAFYDEEGKRHVYRKEVTKETFKTFRDEEPYAYGGNESAWANPYGFCPAVWVRHVNVGGEHGEPAVRNLGKIERLNSLASHAIDHAHKILEAPILIAGDEIQALQAPAYDQSEDYRETERRSQEIPIIKGLAGSTISTAELPQGEVLLVIDRMLTEIENDHPELTMYRELRRMSQVTGPAVSRMFGDVEVYLNDARASYDMQSIKLFQMGVAVAGYRLSSGAWEVGQELTREHQYFRPFGLDSFARGDLTMEIGPRELVPLGRWETVQVERAENALRRERMELALGADGLMSEGAQGLAGQLPVQISQRLRMRTATEGAPQTQNAPTP